MTKEELLAAVNAVDWKKHESAMRRWRDIPASLRYLLNYEPEPTRTGRWLRTISRARISSKKDAIDNLVLELEHQGGAYPAALPAIPILCQLLPFLEPPERVSVTRLLISICLPFSSGFELYNEAPLWEPQYYRLVERYSDCFLPLLDDSATTFIGSYAVAWFPRVGRPALPKLLQLSTAAPEELRMSAILARGLLKDSICIPDEDSGPRLRRLSAIAKAYGTGACEECLRVFIEMSTYVPSTNPVLEDEWLGPWGDSLISIAIEFLRRTDSRIKEQFLENAAEGIMAKAVSQPLAPDSPSELRPWLTLSGIPS